jgi:hypothetical protein
MSSDNLGSGRGTVYGRATPPASPPTAAPPRRGIRRVIGFFDTTAKVIGAVTALIVAAAGLWAALAQILGPAAPGPTTDQSDPAVVARQIQACQEHHRMSESSDVIVGGDERPYTFRSCTWPPPPYADRDGFSQITVTTVVGVVGASEADNSGYADRIRGRCRTFEFAYDHGKMGEVTHHGPVRAKPGDLLIGGDGVPYPGEVRDLDFYPGPDEVVVLHNSSYVIVRASCYE